MYFKINGKIIKYGQNLKNILFIVVLFDKFIQSCFSKSTEIIYRTFVLEIAINIIISMHIFQLFFKNKALKHEKMILYVTKLPSTVFAHLVHNIIFYRLAFFNKYVGVFFTAVSFYSFFPLFQTRVLLKTKENMLQLIIALLKPFTPFKTQIDYSQCHEDVSV